MKMTKMEMYGFLTDVIGIGQETMDALITVMGDSNDTYKRILTKMTDFKTFEEADEFYRFQDFSE